VSKDLNETKKFAAGNRSMGIENQSKFTNAMVVVNQILTPEQQNSLAIQGIDIQNLQKDLDNVTQEITTIYSTIPAEKANVPTPTL